MRNNDIIKPPITAGGQQTLKVEYGYRVSNAPMIVVIMFISFFIVVAIFGTLGEIENGADIGDVIMSAVVPLIFLVGFGIISIFAFKKGNERNRDRLQKIQEAMQNGKKVTGTLAEIQSYRVGTGDDAHTEYRLVVNFPNPENGETKCFVTPSFRQDLGVRNVDLPLNVTVYCYQDFVYVDEILNPPLDKIEQRRKKLTAISLIIIVSFIATAVLVVMEQYLPAVIVIVVGIVLAVALSATTANEDKRPGSGIK